jgi:HAMP domain-containing protein/signal transduction histidine kinase/CheY-like chemotaxis protein
MTGEDRPDQAGRNGAATLVDTDLAELLSALRAAREGDFSTRLRATDGGGMLAQVAGALNDLLERNDQMSRELVRVGNVIGREGRMTERAALDGAGGAWATNVDSVNALIDDLVRPTTEVARVIVAVAEGDLSQKMALKIGGQPVKGEFLRIGTTVNTMVDQLSAFADEVTRVAREVGTEGKLGGQAEVPGVAGTWKDLTESVNFMASNLTDQVRNIAQVTTAVAQGDLSQKITVDVKGEILELKNTINTMVDQLSSFADEVTRVAREVGTEGELGGQAEVQGVSGTWRGLTESVNGMANNLTDQVRNIAQVTTAVAQGDLSQKITVEAKGEVAALADTINSMTDTLRVFAEQVTSVAREVGTEGVLGGQAEVPGVAGTWKDLTESVNGMASNLTDQVRNIAQVATAVAQGDLSQKITVEAKGEVAALADTINSMTDTLRAFADEVTRVAREVGTDGKLGGQAGVPGVAGTWKDLTDSVNFMASNLTDQVRNIAQVTTAVAQGDLSQKITVDVKGEILELKNTINTMVDQLSSFAAEVTSVAREVGTEGKLGGQAEVPGVAGTWKDLTESVNFMASNLTDQVRNIAQVTTAVAQGDLSQKITVDVKGEILELKNTINTMVEQLRSFAAEVTRVAREVGTEGKLGGQAEVEDVSGTWRGLTENVNLMAANLTGQVRNIAQVTTAVANGDLSKKITVEAKGEVAALADTINTMVEQLRSFAAEVTRVAREVGTEGKLGGQAEVAGVSGTWRGLTENVNLMASNLTDQVRNIAQVTTAVAQGDLSQKITVDAKGEILELKDTINTMVDQLSSFADEVTRVAREVGTEGKLGGQAEVEDVSGTWRRLTENVNQLAGNLTTQVRAIAEVSTAVTQGDLTRSISVEAQGEVAELKDNINQMIANLRDTTTRNEEQDWLKTNLARISGLMQGQRELATVTQLIMSELTPTVSAQHGAFFLTESDADGQPRELRLIASYGYTRRNGIPDHFGLGESLIGQAALERKTIRIDDAPGNYIRVSSGLGDAPPASILIMPILFEDQVLGVIELAWLRPPSEIHRTFLEQLMETLGVVLNTIIANMRTEELLQQSQSLNAELEQQAQLLEERNLDIEGKNREIEQARLGLEEKAAQLALSSRYKSEFLANMSHELRTPLNSLLILSKLLLDNEAGNLTAKQMDFARTIRAAGSDLLELINDILDLSKIEAGKMDLLLDALPLADVCAYVQRTFEPVAADKGLTLDVVLADGVPSAIVTDEQRLQQILRNLLSNAFKFTAVGGVTLRIERAGDDAVSFSVTDTGIGIAEDKLAVIFEAFQQADGTTSRNYGGTGLGLSISRELARALGGELNVQSIVDRGSIFTLTLWLDAAHHGTGVLAQELQVVQSNPVPALGPGSPVRPVEEPAATPAAQDGPSRQVVGRPAVSTRRLLVLDRGGLALHAIRGLVGRDHGVELTTIKDPAEALTVIGIAPPDCLIIGSRLSKTAVFSLLDQLRGRAELSRLPVILRLDRRVTERDSARLRRYEPDLLPRIAESDEALAAEAALVLHPASGPAVAGPAQNGENGDAKPAAPRLQGRILLVDDDVRNLFALASLLEDRGLEVVFSETGREALEILGTDDRIDLVLMDIMMPQMDGYETIKAARAMPALGALPIIAVTAKAMQGDREKSIAAGASDYITKPVDPDKLMSLVSGWLCV